MSVTVLEDIAKNYQSEGQQYYLVNSEGKIFLGGNGEASKNEQEELALKNVFADLALTTGKEENRTKSTINQLSKTRQLVSIAPPTELEGIQELNWQTLIAKDEAVAFADQRKLGFTLAIGIGVTSLLVGAIAPI
ncbi:MAG: hypothetical protein HC930_17185 [Hydrococcus sp. SU_1_0]|nr:hypothetical protein [Hydrococcus sp. SU_1_0]